jgi:methyl-accepting chemotaxis protein
MKNWTITKRIIFGFVVLVVLSAGMGIVAWNSMRHIETAADNVSNDSVPGLAMSSDVMQNLARAHLLLIRDVLTTNLDAKHTYDAQMEETGQAISGQLDKLDKLSTSQEERQLFEKMKQARQDYLTTRAPILQLSNAGKSEEALDQMLGPGRVAYNAYDELATKFNGLETKAATDSAGSIQQSARRSEVILGAILVGELVLSVLLAGLVVTGLNRVLYRVSSSLHDGANQVASASSQVSAASQSLAQGSGEQASSLEETSSSLEELTSMTKRNAGNAEKVNDLAKQARQAADKGAADMQVMSQAMQAIKVSSDDIAKIIKTIDEIAFQTNILALNAAVEAARAGEAGMGFAVVADEVRNLAQRSAQAAKETAAKIEGAIGKTGQGVDLSAKVSQTLNEIVAKVRQVDELVSEVAHASREQTQGITQINTAVEQMDKVTQSNAATAEESAAAAEELNAQADVMRQAVDELVRLVSGAGKTSGAGEATKRAYKVQNDFRAPKQAAPVPAVNGNGKHAEAAKPVNGRSQVPVGSKPEVAARRDQIPLEGDFRDF